MVKATLLLKTKKEDYFEFFIEDADVHILNAIRRAILSETVTMAIHDIYIYQNTSVVPDELLAQRLGLIPLRIDPSELDLTEEAGAVRPDMRRLLKFTAKMRLMKRNIPKNKNIFEDAKSYDVEIITAYSGDLKAVDKKTLRPVSDKIPIARLGPYQEIDVECVVKVGRGRDHAKFSPVSTVAYKIMPRMEVADTCDGCGDCVDACPFGSLKMELGKPVLRGLGLYTCTLCRLCVRACSKKALLIEPNYKDYLFRIKLIGQLTMDEILDQVEVIFKNRLDYLLELIEKEIASLEIKSEQRL